jgi:hypothetical protein
VKILVRNLLDIKHGLAQVPEELVGLRGSELVAEQNDAVVGHKGLHGGHERAHGLLDVNDVGGDDVVEGRVKGLDLVGVVPVEDGVLEGFGEDGFVALEVAFQSGHHGGYVGQYQVGESQEVETEEEMQVLGGSSRLFVWGSSRPTLLRRRELPRFFFYKRISSLCKIIIQALAKHWAGPARRKAKRPKPKLAY